jgi:hypothetical protein
MSLRACIVLLCAVIVLSGVPAHAGDSSAIIPPVDAIKDPLQKILYNSIKLSLSKDDDMKEIDAVVNDHLKKSGNWKKVPLESLVGYKGSVASKDAASALMEADVSLKSLASAELKLEKKIDERYLEMLVLITELVGVMSYDDYTDRMGYKAAMQNLSQLIGDSDAQNVVQQLSALKATYAAQAPKLRAHALSPMDFAEQRKILIDATERNDVVLQDLIAKVNQTTEERKDSDAVNQSLSVLSLVPGGLGAAATLAQLGLDDDPADDARLLYSIYLYKRLELRKRIIFASVANALHAYEVSIETNNPFLGAFAVSTMTDLAGAEVAQQIAASPTPGWEQVPPAKTIKTQSAAGK